LALGGNEFPLVIQDKVFVGPNITVGIALVNFGVCGTGARTKIRYQQIVRLPKNIPEQT
jgi:hypothetical protein